MYVHTSKVFRDQLHMHFHIRQTFLSSACNKAVIDEKCSFRQNTICTSRFVRANITKVDSTYLLTRFPSEMSHLTWPV